MDSILRTLPLHNLRRTLCPSCLQSLVRRPGLGLPTGRRISERQRHSKAHISQSGEQANPLAGYYAELLNKPISETTSAAHTPATVPPPDELPKTDREELLSKARVVFGSRLAGPIQRRSEIQRASINIAGVLVPPKPEEPDNCCMSGCVNCVWDNYRDELEEWASKSAEARERVLAQRSKGRGVGTGSMIAEPGMPPHVATSMDDDGGGSETNWDAGLAMSGKEGDIFKDVPVGIREFMRTEKMLKNRHREERASV